MCACMCVCVYLSTCGTTPVVPQDRCLWLPVMAFSRRKKILFLDPHRAHVGPSVVVGHAGRKLNRLNMVFEILSGDRQKHVMFGQERVQECVTICDRERMV